MHWHPAATARTLVTGGTDGVARLWDASEGSERCSVATRADEQVYVVEFAGGDAVLLLGE